MHKYYPIVLLFLLSASILVFTSFEDNTSSPGFQLKERLLNNFDDLEKKLGSLSAEIRVYESNEIAMQRLRGVYLECRKTYKKTEALSAYLQPEFTLDYLNGAPLLKLERNVTAIVVLEPKGFQPLDEVIFDDDFDRAKALDLTERLKNDAAKAALYFRRIELNDRHVFEAMRMQLVRIFTLGVTGFDTPSSGNALPDAQVSMEELRDSWRYYRPILNSTKPVLAAQIDERFTFAVNFLDRNRDFDGFDRLEFLVEVINPLYDKLLSAQLALNIETIYEVSGTSQAVNYFSTNIFSNDFLNPYYYTALQEKDDNEMVRKLGKTLFYDPILSSNGKRSCASCHNPHKGFTDGMTKSLAMDLKGTVNRNAPTLINAVFADRYFHDLRASKLEEQIEHVVVNDKEFHTTYKEIIGKLSQSNNYQELFRKAFPAFREPVFKYTISMALASYLTSLTGFNSEFDQYARGEVSEVPLNIRNGFNLFMGKAACGTCHFAPVFNGTVPPAFTESESEVLGVPANKDKESAVMDADLGRMGAKLLREESPIYKNSFKTVTVRNIELTAPYMHNGVYNTLEEVLDFYHGGGGAGLGFDLPNQTLAPDSLDLNDSEKQDIIAFMKSLTDTTGMTNMPTTLPEFEHYSTWNSRKIGGDY